MYFFQLANRVRLGYLRAVQHFGVLQIAKNHADTVIRKFINIHKARTPAQELQRNRTGSPVEIQNQRPGFYGLQNIKQHLPREVVCRPHRAFFVGI